MSKKENMAKRAFPIPRSLVISLMLRGRSSHANGDKHLPEVHCY